MVAGCAAARACPLTRKRHLRGLDLGRFNLPSRGKKSFLPAILHLWKYGCRSLVPRAGLLDELIKSIPCGRVHICCCWWCGSTSRCRQATSIQMRTFKAQRSLLVGVGPRSLLFCILEKILAPAAMTGLMPCISLD